MCHDARQHHRKKQASADYRPYPNWSTNRCHAGSSATADPPGNRRKYAWDRGISGHAKDRVFGIGTGTKLRRIDADYNGASPALNAAMITSSSSGTFSAWIGEHVVSTPSARRSNPSRPSAIRAGRQGSSPRDGLFSGLRLFTNPLDAPCDHGVYHIHCLDPGNTKGVRQIQPVTKLSGRSGDAPRRRSNRKVLSYPQFYSVAWI